MAVNYSHSVLVNPQGDRSDVTLTPVSIVEYVH